LLRNDTERVFKETRKHHYIRPTSNFNQMPQRATPDEESVSSILSHSLRIRSAKEKESK
jgi:hypothetical protein